MEFDSAVLATGLAIIAIPIFVLGFRAQFLSGVQLEIAPVTVGRTASVGCLLPPDRYAMSFAYVVRLTCWRCANAHADYVRTATARGLSRPRVVTVHILRNSPIPVVPSADLGALTGGATEGIFNIHGVGGVLYHGHKVRRRRRWCRIVTVLVLIYLITNLLVGSVCGPGPADPLWLSTRGSARCLARVAPAQFVDCRGADPADSVVAALCR